MGNASSGAVQQHVESARKTGVCSLSGLKLKEVSKNTIIDKSLPESVSDVNTFHLCVSVSLTVLCACVCVCVRVCTCVVRLCCVCV